MTKENKEKFKRGYYVTIVKPDSNYTPAIFWVYNKTIWVFSPGVSDEPIEHRKTIDETIHHFENMEKDGCAVMVAGYCD